MARFELNRVLRCLFPRLYRLVQLNHPVRNKRCGCTGAKKRYDPDDFIRPPFPPEKFSVKNGVCWAERGNTPRALRCVLRQAV